LTNQGIYVPRVHNRTCLDLYRGTEEELDEECGEGEGESVIGQPLSPIEVDSDKTGRMWYTALRKEGTLPGRCRMSEW
jgi:hypothetical protein